MHENTWLDVVQLSCCSWRTDQVIKMKQQWKTMFITIWILNKPHETNSIIKALFILYVQNTPTLLFCFAWSNFKPERRRNQVKQEIILRGSGHMLSLLFWQWFNNAEASAGQLHEHLFFQNRKTGGENSHNHSH